MPADMRDRSNLRGLVLLGAALGIYHLFCAFFLLYVFREGAPSTSKIAVIAGPFLTLPAVILAIFRRKLGGMLLIAGGITSLIAVSLGEGVSVGIVPFLFLITGPMVIVGGGFFVLRR